MPEIRPLIYKIHTKPFTVNINFNINYYDNNIRINKLFCVWFMNKASNTISGINLKNEGVKLFFFVKYTI